MDNPNKLSRGKSPDKHARILAAALKVFAANGFYQSKVSEIARQAEVADGTIYLYFQNKDDILISLFEEAMGRVIEEMEAALAGVADPVLKLETFARTHLGLVDSHRDVAEILQIEVRQSSKFMKEYRNERFLQYLDIIASILREGQAAGLFRLDADPDVAKRAFFGALDEMSRYWVLSSRRAYSIDFAAKQISQYFLAGITLNQGSRGEAGSKVEVA